MTPTETDQPDTNNTAATVTETDTEADDDADDQEDQGVESYDVDDETADLVELQNGETELVAEQELETCDYQSLQLVVSDVDATLEAGGDAEVTTPGTALLKFNQAFEIRADTRTIFTADFTPVKQGASGGYTLQPVAQGTEVSYEE